MKYFTGYLLKFLIGVIDNLVPVNPNIWLFYITPATIWDANMQCVYTLARKKENIRCVICYHRPRVIPDLPDTLCLNFLSFAGFWNCLRAGVLFFDHASVPGISRRSRQCVNLWHGIPIKQIRFFCPQNFPAGYLKLQRRCTSWLIASSAVDRLAMIAGFQMKPQRVVVTGLPRNDLLVDVEPFIRALPYLKDEQKRLQTLLQGRKLILYAPTYRDSKSSRQDDFVRVSNEEKQYLSSILRKHDAVLGIREHVYATASVFSVMHESDRVVHLDPLNFTNINLLLRSVDILVTDYSSIWVDFLLLDRPVVGYCPDLASYTASHGFLYDFEKIFPGPIVKSLRATAECIDLLLGEPWRVPEKQKMVCNLFHKYRDGKSSERVIRHLENALPVSIDRRPGMDECLKYDD